jgi:Fe-S-cluster-containing dehydrogenase component
LADRPLPSEKIRDRSPILAQRPGFVVDLRRCIGCHACSVACKTAHEVPLGEFPMRVRWLPRPEDKTLKTSGQESRTFAFVPVFSESLCHDDSESTQVGMDPACVRACPTDALFFGDIADENSSLSRMSSSNPPQTLKGPSAKDLKEDVIYIGLEDWVSDKLNQGAALDPRDEDPIYEQR